MADVVVIGAGISGLTCAWQVRRAGLDVVLLEAGGRPGGVIQSHRIGDYIVESGPNTILPTARSLQIISDAGLSDQLLGAPLRSPRFIYVGGRLRRVPWVLSIRGAMRAIAEPFRPRRPNHGDESLHSFFTRRFGAEVHDRLVAPFVGGIYAGDTRQLSLQATFPRIEKLEARYGSVVLGMLRERRSGARHRLSSFGAGMETLPAGLARNLDIRYGVDVARLSLGWKVETTEEVFEPSAVVVATPSDAVCELLRPVDLELSALFDAVPCAPIIVAASAFDERSFKVPLTGFGFLVPRTEGFHTLGTLYSSSLFANRAPGGKVLLTSFLGGALEPEVVDWSDDRLWETVESEMKTMLPLEGGMTPLALFRYRRAIPQYHLGHSQWRTDVLRRIAGKPGLFLAGNYLNGVSVPASMEQGQQVGDAVIEYVRRTS